MRFSMQAYWSGLPFPSPGDLPSPGIEPWSLRCRQILYGMSHQGSPKNQGSQCCKPQSKGKNQEHGRPRTGKMFLLKQRADLPFLCLFVQFRPSNCLFKANMIVLFLLKQEKRIKKQIRQRENNWLASRLLSGYINYSLKINRLNRPVKRYFQAVGQKQDCSLQAAYNRCTLILIHR